MKYYYVIKEINSGKYYLDVDSLVKDINKAWLEFNSSEARSECSSLNRDRKNLKIDQKFKIQKCKLVEVK